jgi:UDP-N-acetylglucosamine:LPS N-acetylglucosamine transferase
MSKKTIVFAAIHAGGGHVRPAELICQALNSQYPGKYETRLLDFMKDLGCTRVDNRHKRSWRWLLARPLLTKSLQLLSYAGGPLTRRVAGMYISPFYAYLRRYLEEQRPDLIFSTHFFNTMAVSRVRRRYSLPVSLINYLTEIFDCNAYWFLKDVDHYLVSSERVLRGMRRRRFPADKLHLFAYPMPEPQVLSAGETTELRKSLGLDPAHQTLMISFGGEGIGPLERNLDALASRGLPLNIVAVCGRNSELEKKLKARFPRKQTSTRIIPLGYISYIQKVIFISDICFIKPGPATTREVMTYRKPILFTRSSQRSETKIMRYACGLGIACYGGSRSASITRLVEKMMRPSYQEACRACYDGLDLSSGAHAIARFIDSTLTCG